MKTLYLLLIFCLSAQAIVKPKTIYGEDNRQDLYEVTDSKLRKMSDPIAAIFYNGRLSLNEDGHFSIQSSYSNRGRALNLCSTEKFRDQPITAYCTGFLVAPDIVATAGHCISDETDCDWSSVVFHFAYTQPNSQVNWTHKDNVYKCKQVIKASFSPAFGFIPDYALIRLDRPVKNITPLQFNSAALDDNAKLVVMGHPDGMPLKIAAGAYVKKNKKHSHFFVTNTDTYGGNSGSPVMNLETGFVEGILVRGPKDYVMKGDCRVSNVCAMDKCSGELVTKGQLVLPHL